MSYSWVESMKARRQSHLNKAREYRTGQHPTCTNPDYWAKYHRGEAMKLARIINSTGRKS